MSAKQVVSPLSKMIPVIFQWLTALAPGSRLVVQLHVQLFVLQNVAAEGSEEEGLYAFTRWLLGEFWRDSG